MPQKRLSMTYDQGKEMAWHEKLAEDTGIKVYFTAPHSPWRRGINENGVVSTQRNRSVRIHSRRTGSDRMGVKQQTQKNIELQMPSRKIHA